MEASAPTTRLKQSKGTSAVLPTSDRFPVRMAAAGFDATNFRGMMPATSLGWARLYLSMQAGAGACWWLSIALSSQVREWTLGGWNPALLAAPDLVLFVGGSVVVAWRAIRPAIIALIGWTTAITGALCLYALVEQRAGWGAAIMVISLAGTVASGLTVWHGTLPVDWFFLGPFQFREARPDSAGRQVRNSVIQLIAFWTFFLVFVPLVLSWLEHRVRIDLHWLDRSEYQPVGIALFAIASSLGLWSCLSMALRGHGTPLPAATASTLVIAGPYRYVRNPMAVAGALQTIGVGFWIGSWTTMLSAVAGAVIWNVAIRPGEEADLASRFGDDYLAYQQTARCWVPGVQSLGEEP